MGRKFWSEFDEKCDGDKFKHEIRGYMNDDNIFNLDCSVLITRLLNVCSVLLISFGSCQEKKIGTMVLDENLKWQETKVLVSDNDFEVRANLCNCFFLNDTLSISVGKIGIYGITLVIRIYKNQLTSYAVYWSDLKDPDGENEKKVPAKNIYLKLNKTSGFNVNDTINGIVQMETVPIDFFEDGRTVRYNGGFSCEIRRINK
ncbi:hypothetical protein JYT51_01285 [Candidatus Amoebophilus asiaticus]|nr:hypothetical protein [Candidatus Amoebophilus asiaticus]